MIKRWFYRRLLRKWEITPELINKLMDTEYRIDLVIPMYKVCSLLKEMSNDR